VWRNLTETEFPKDPNKAVPLHKRNVKVMEVDVEEKPKELMQKPCVLNDLEAEASLPENTLCQDLNDYICYNVENCGEDCKAMAWIKKDYHQDTPK
jgi:hypothetical protein